MASSKTNSKKKVIRAREWFEDLVGFPEKEWTFDLESVRPVLEPHWGHFETVSVDSLTGRVEKEVKTRSDDIPPLRVLTRRDTSRHVRHFDVSAVQHWGAPKSMIQVASNFNCLEVPSEHTDPFHGEFLTNLMTDTTQGPSASAGAGPGAIFRLGRHRQEPIDLLEATEELKPKNGKLILSSEKKQSKGKRNIDSGKVKVGLHTNVRAMYDRSGDPNHVIKNVNAPLVDQVYASTCVQRSPHERSKEAGALLKAAYDGTYACCALRQSPTLVLTCIGGQSFQNNPCQIARAIVDSHSYFGKYLRRDCKVVLPIYGTNHKILEELKPCAARAKVKLEVENYE